MRRAALTAVRAGLLLLGVVLAFFSGGFFEGARLVAAICAWALLALASAPLLVPAVRRVLDGAAGRSLIGVLQATGRAELVYGVLLGLGLALS